jgi:hypothetical protein
MLFLATLEHAQIDPKQIYKGPQSGKMYGPMSELKNKPLTKSSGAFCKRNGPKQPENRFSILFLAILGSFGNPQMDQKMYSKVASGRHEWPNV